MVQHSGQERLLQKVMIEGLLTQKPGREPAPGETKCFIVENRVSQSGNPWTKIKNATSDQGGGMYKILSVKPTGHTDSYGNISFNLEIEPSNMGTSAQVPSSNLSAGGQVQLAAPLPFPPRANDDRSNRIERQHSQHMFLLVCQIKGSVPATTAEVRAGIDWWQRDISRVPLSAIEQQAKTMFNATEVPAEGEKENEIPF
jgi:hypothetical protein